MSIVTCQISVSLDGYVAGPNQTMDDPLGEGGERLHEWAVKTDSWREHPGRSGGERTADSEVIEEVTRNVGAYIMGRNMFGPAGAWDPEWRGWWGDDPPFHTPVYVLTHHARAAARERDVMIAGGASAVQQYLRAGLLDELYLHIAPVILGAGERLLEDVGNPTLEPVQGVASPAATHVKYRVVR